MLDPAIRDLARGKNFGTLSFQLSNGLIASHVMWVDADDDHVLINTEVHRMKYKAIVAAPGAVTVTVWDAQNPYRYAEVRGTFVGEVRGAEARAHIDACSQRYIGVDYQPAVQSERVIMKIAPVRQRANGLS
jgi:hypothetical protein